jgi:hypothetical protein
MNKNLVRLIAALIMLLLQTVTTAGTENGKTLTGKHCTGCHDDSMYTREDRRVTTLSALQNQVRHCETNLELKWFEDDITDVTNHLNTQYYKFE